MSAASRLQPPPLPRRHDVTVIGAGWSGLVSCKYMLEECLTIVALEKREDVGGVWLYSDDPNLSTIMKSTQSPPPPLSMKCRISQCPRRYIGMFPHHSDVIQYLHSYAEKFNLHPHIRFNTSVKSVEKRGEDWWVKCSNEDEYISTYIIIATGEHQTPNRELEDTLLRRYMGKVYHAQEIKEVIDEHRGQRLLVVGGGETGSDLCIEWHNHTKFTYWSIPRGQHFFKKDAKITPWGNHKRSIKRLQE